MYKVVFGRGKGPHFFITDLCAQLCKSVHYADYTMPILHPMRDEVHEAAQYGLIDYMAASTTDFCLAWPTRALRRAHIGFVAKVGLYIEPVTTENKMPDESKTEPVDMLRIDVENLLISKDNLSADSVILSANMPVDMVDKIIALTREGFSLTQGLINMAKPTCKCEHGNETKHP